MTGTVLRTTHPLAHLRCRLVLDAAGNRTWALLPREDAPLADVPLVSGFCDGPEALTPQALRELALHLEVFMELAEEWA